jgi:hypothetical protein
MPKKPTSEKVKGIAPAVVQSSEMVQSQAICQLFQINRGFTMDKVIRKAKTTG